MSPPITTVAKGRWTSAPAPCERAMGMKPKLATSAVIRTGRSRVIAPANSLFDFVCSLSKFEDVGDQHDSVENGNTEQGNEPYAR